MAVPQRASHGAKEIARIPRAKYDIMVQENAEFLQPPPRHMRQWLERFEEDLRIRRYSCQYLENSLKKEKFSRRLVTDGPLVLFQVMKDMQAYKRQWEEMSFNNLDSDELPPPAFTTEKLVDFIKKCPVVQRFPGRFNKRGKFERPRTKRLYDYTWLLEHIGDRFIECGAREALSFTRSSVRLRHGLVSAAVTREDPEAEPEQDLDGFLCAESTGRKQETSVTIFAALPHVMRIDCALKQAKDDIFAALRAFALESAKGGLRIPPLSC